MGTGGWQGGRGTTGGASPRSPGQQTLWQEHVMHCRKHYWYLTRKNKRQFGMNGHQENPKQHRYLPIKSIISNGTQII